MEKVQAGPALRRQPAQRRHKLEGLPTGIWWGYGDGAVTVVPGTDERD